MANNDSSNKAQNKIAKGKTWGPVVMDTQGGDGLHTSSRFPLNLSDPGLLTASPWTSVSPEVKWAH